MYYGPAISHELRTAFMYESDYASRESVYRNIDRAIEEVMSQPVTIGWDDFECHTANACEGMEERLQLMMRDSAMAPTRGRREEHRCHISTRHDHNRRQLQQPVLGSCQDYAS